MSDTVIIRKQRVKLKVVDEQQALRVRQVISDDLQTQLESIFERVFDANSSSELCVNINKLNIDLGVLPESEIRENFIRSVEPKLLDELQKQLQHYMDHGPHDAAMELNSIADQEFKALTQFLETGVFPWWYSQHTHKTPLEILDALREEGIEKLLLHLTMCESTRPSEALDRVIERLFIHLNRSGHEPIIHRLIDFLNDGRLKVNADAILKNRTAIEAIFSIDARKVYKHLFGFLLQGTNRNGDNFMVNFFQRVISKENINVESLSESDFNRHFNGQFTPIIDGKKESSKIRPTNAREDFKEGEVYIGNAGLLLLHPFLQTLFSENGLLTLDAKNFGSVQSKQKAAVLLYYLQSGESDYKEWEMPFNKILCAMQYQATVPDNIILTDREKQNCDELLTAVVSHWTALKGAGIEALRNTFLLRAGKMSLKDSHWLMQVERTSVDILLDKLPWGYGTIKLPWLDQLILTEW